MIVWLLVISSRRSLLKVEGKAESKLVHRDRGHLSETILLTLTSHAIIDADTTIFLGNMPATVAKD